MEAGERVAKIPLTPSFFTLPIAGLELVAAALVLSHASTAEDMAPVVYATAFVLNLFLLAAFHYFAATTRLFLLWCFLVWKGLFSVVLAFVIWEKSLPHKVWTGEAFRLTEPSRELVTAAIIMALTTVGLIVFRIVISTGRWMKRVEVGDA